MNNAASINLAQSLQNWVGDDPRYQSRPGLGRRKLCADGVQQREVRLHLARRGRGAGFYDVDGARQWVKYIHPFGEGDGSHHGVNSSPTVVGDKIILLGWSCWLGFDKSARKGLC